MINYLVKNCYIVLVILEGWREIKQVSLPHIPSHKKGGTN
jgi:hypothetical protein